MMRFIKTFDDYETPIVPFEVNITRQGIETVANQFIEYIGNIYKLRRNKEYDNEIGNSVWFTKRFYEWAENNRTQCRIIYFYDSDDEEKKPHIAIIIEDLVLDFTHKKLSEDPKEKFYIGHPKTYIKYGYDKYELLDDFPNWTEKAKSLKYI
jgi:hypothetical protein